MKHTTPYNGSVVALNEELIRYHTPIYVYTAFFGTIFIVGPFLVRKGPDKGIIRCCIMLTAFCMWLLWVTMYIAQMNPLMGPRVSNHTMIWISRHWGFPIVNEPDSLISDDSD